MLHRSKDLFACMLLAEDGDIGKLDGMYFDDQTWTVRYLVVRTGNWLNGRRVLLSPTVVRRMEPEQERVAISLTREQVQNSPGVDPDKPLSRSDEVKLSRFYRWPAYWERPASASWLAGGRATATATEERQRERYGPDHPAGEVRLRGSLEVEGYHIGSPDGEIGHVDGFVVDDVAWSIRYLVVQTSNWLPGAKMVLLSPRWFNDIGWDDRRVRVGPDGDSVRNAPEYDESRPLLRDYESRLWQHYQQRPYWE